MKKRRRIIHPVALILCLATATGAAQVRTWVSADGSDANPCSRTAPCRNFAAAIAAVNPGGEVVVLDSGGFGPVAINKAVTILAPEGIHAAIAPTAGQAIDLTNPGGPVILRNLFLNGQGAQNGIRIGGLDDPVSIRNCVVSGFSFYGVLVFQDAIGPIAVTDSEFRNNGITGLRYGGDTPGSLLVERAHMERNPEGFVAFGTGAVTIRRSVAAGGVGSGFQFIKGSGQRASLFDCVAANNEEAGFRAFNPTVGTTLTIHLDRCSSYGNREGILAVDTVASVDIYVARSSIVFNNEGLKGGEIHSRGDNTLENNTVLVSNLFTDPAFPTK